jgi:hypothetical protein
MLLEAPLALTLFASVTLLVTTRSSRPRLVALGGSWVLLVVARPESLALVAAIATFFVVREARGRRDDLVLPLAVAALGLGAYFAWHTHYFGQWAPNT